MKQRQAADRHIESLTKEWLGMEKVRSQPQHRCQNTKDTSLERTAETHPKFPVNMSPRGLQKKRESITKRLQDSRNRLSDDAVHATRTKNRQHKQKSQLHKGLEGYETFNRIIFNPAEHRCTLCSRLMYEISLANSRLTAQQTRFLNSSGCL